MKIGYSGLDLPDGKVKYDDPLLEALAQKCNPKKVSPYYVEFLLEEYTQVDVIVISPDKLLDLLIIDMELCEAILERNKEGIDKSLIDDCLASLEKEIPLCDMGLSKEAAEALRSLALVSLKPVITLEGSDDVTEVINTCFQKAGIVFFYTAGDKEVHAWPVKEGSDIVTCAGKIHTDMIRGFIKGDIAKFDDFMDSHSFNDCKKKGLVQVVDRDYIITPGDIIEIRFNV